MCPVFPPPLDPPLLTQFVCMTQTTIAIVLCNIAHRTFRLLPSKWAHVLVDVPSNASTRFPKTKGRSCSLDFGNLVISMFKMHICADALE